MSRPARFGWLVPVAITLVATSGFGAVANDAGSGHDAGNSAGAALTLPGPGSYDGRIDLLGDQDWYRLPSSAAAPVCSRATATGLPATLQLQPRAAGAGPTVSAGFNADTTARIGVARLALDETRLGIVDPGAKVIGAYGFTIHHLRPTVLGPGDGASGRDAGASTSSAVPVSGPCIGGSLGGNDWLDLYSFNGATGNKIVFSLASVKADDPVPASNYLTLVRPDLSVVRTIENGQIMNHTLDQAGTWYYAVSSASGTSSSYTVGSCHPHCLLWS